MSAALLLPLLFPRGVATLLQTSLLRALQDRSPEASRRFRVYSLHFPPYAMRHGHGAPLSEGLELQLVGLLAERTGLVLEVVDGGEESWLSNLEKVRNGTADACVGGYWAAHERIGAFAMTPPYAWERLRLYVPPPTPRPGWQSVFLVFDASVWALLLLSVGAATLLAAHVSNARDWGGEHRLIGAATATFSTLLYAPPPTPALHRPRLRAVLLLWAVFCLQLNVAFQSALVGVLVNPGWEADVSSVTQLLGAASSLTPTMIKRSVEIMKESEDDRYVALAERAEVCDNMKRCLIRVLRRRRFAVLACEQFARFYVGGAVRSLPETFITYGVVAYLRRDAPYVHRMCAIVTRVVEAGIVGKWAADLRRGRHQHEDDDPYDDDDDAPPDDLGLGNLQAAFWLLGVGLGGASVVLAAEVALDMLRRQHVAH